MKLNVDLTINYPIIEMEEKFTIDQPDYLWFRIKEAIRSSAGSVEAENWTSLVVVITKGEGK